MCTREPRLVLVSLLIGWKSGARTLNQSLSEVMQNQSNSLITFDTQLKTTLRVKKGLHFVFSCAKDLSMSIPLSKSYTQLNLQVVIIIMTLWEKKRAWWERDSNIHPRTNISRTFSCWLTVQALPQHLAPALKSRLNLSFDWQLENRDLHVLSTFVFPCAMLRSRLDSTTNKKITRASFICENNGERAVISSQVPQGNY